MTDLSGLYAEFPREAIHWRAQTLTKDGGKAMALAYIDARDVMRRLDEVVGPENWQDTYVETPKGRVICTLSLRVGDEWIGKSDGAGDTDVEGEKGGISDALKRAAVKWGIGRYLYDMPAPWVPCESHDKGGRKYFREWAEDPWLSVRRPPKQATPPQPKAKKPAPKKTEAPQEFDREDFIQKAVTWLSEATAQGDLDKRLRQLEARWEKHTGNASFPYQLEDKADEMTEQFSGEKAA